MPSSPSERAELLEAIALREAELQDERKHHQLVREAYSYEVRIATQDQHQTRGMGSSSQQEAKLVARHRKPNGGFYIGIDKLG